MLFHILVEFKRHKRLLCLKLLSLLHQPLILPPLLGVQVLQGAHVLGDQPARDLRGDLRLGELATNGATNCLMWCESSNAAP